MSRNKRGGGADAAYREHLYGRFSFNPEDSRTALLERMYVRILTELAVNRFKWSGMPDSIDVRWLELNLFYRALSVFYWDTDYDRFLALQGAGTSFMNMLNNPTAFNVIGNNFVGKTVSARDAVPIWANYLRIPDLDIVQIYATRLAELDRTIEINAHNARRSRILVATENQRLSVENINRQIDEGHAAIRVNQGYSPDMVQNLDLGVDPDSLEKLHILRTRQWNECMGMLGIENANQDKKERLVAAEVDANNDQTSMTRYMNLNARREAADRVNKKWPTLNISVEYRTDAERAAQLPGVGATQGDTNVSRETESENT